jgi:general secretion pathway protein E
LINNEIELAKSLGLKIASSLSDYKFVKEGKNIIPYFFAKQNHILPIDDIGEKILVALSNPLDISFLPEAELLLEKKVEIIFCPKKELERAIEKCYKQKEETESIFSSFKLEEENVIQTADDVEGYDLLEGASDNPVVRMLNAIIIEALQQGASDIHFEPQEEGIFLRHRIDGVLEKRASPPKELQHQLITRLKVIAKLDIAEKRRPQDGRIKLKMAGREIDFRVSIIPVVHGERVVLRILDRENIILGLVNLGMGEELLNTFRKLISMPEGIILVTGPTGSGKTTTLYSALQEINSSGVNIMTIEDPVEYKLPSIAQIGVNQKIGLTFASGLRHILRQDPDCIMIGEIRDLETAEIAIQSSLTGHLVFSTLHTNDAPSAITRLSEMGIEPYLLSSSIIGVLAQRLVRKICPHCKVAYEPSLDELKRLNLKKKEAPLLYRGQGCSFCFQTGYKGRHGLYELMVASSSVKKQVMKSVEASSLREVAIECGMKGLLENSAQIVKEGVTTTTEVFRVTKAVESGEE